MQMNLLCEVPKAIKLLDDSKTKKIMHFTAHWIQPHNFSECDRKLEHSMQEIILIKKHFFAPPAMATSLFTLWCDYGFTHNFKPFYVGK